MPACANKVGRKLASHHFVNLQILLKSDHTSLLLEHVGI